MVREYLQPPPEEVPFHELPPETRAALLALERPLRRSRRPLFIGVFFTLLLHAAALYLMFSPHAARQAQEMLVRFSIIDEKEAGPAPAHQTSASPPR